MKADKFKKMLMAKVYEMEDLLKPMPQKGDTPYECQKLNLLDALKKFEHCVNGIEDEDFKPNKKK